MPTKVYPLKSVKRVVVVFDVCSSTTILEDLLRSENPDRWRNLLVKLKGFLTAESKKAEFEIYKFLGDGWILLFDASIDGLALMRFLQRLCARYEDIFYDCIFDLLSGSEHGIGLTFGVDRGTLVEMEMDGVLEYIGRPLNVAARLQGAIRQRDKRPEGKLLISKSARVHLELSKSGTFAGKQVERDLPNVAGGQNYQAWKVVVYAGSGE